MNVTRVVILGASGFLGSWCVRALLAQGHEVEVISMRRQPGWRIDGVPGFSFTHSELESWATEIERSGADTVISLDWEGVGGAHRDQESVQTGNLARLSTVVAASVRAGVKRFVGVGSQAEYGRTRGVVDEEASLNPTTAYGRAKVEGLRSLQRLADLGGMEWAWARVFSVYGPLEGDGWLFPAIADSFREARAISLTRAEQSWSYLYAADAAHALMALATHPGARGAYNVGSGNAPPLRQSIETFSRSLGAGGLLRFGAKAEGGIPVELRPDVSRLESLGWREQTVLDRGLRVTAQWMTGHPVADPFALARLLPSRPSVSGS